MAIHDVPFYFSTVRKVVAAFGTVFNNITIERRDANGLLTKDFKVPIGWGSKQHWYYRIEKGVIQDAPTVQEAIVVPRIGYLLTSFAPDPVRNLNRNNREKLDVVEVDGVRSRRYQYVPVPYKFEFELSIYSKNMDDCLAVAEQIAPYFNPTVNLRILEIADMQIWNDCQITMTGGIPIADTYEEGFTGRKSITLDMNFTMTANLYQPISEQRVIRTSIIDIDNLNPRYDLETITAEANPGENSNKDNSTLTIEIQTG